MGKISRELENVENVSHEYVYQAEGRYYIAKAISKLSHETILSFNDFSDYLEEIAKKIRKNGEPST